MYNKYIYIYIHTYIHTHIIEKCKLARDSLDSGRGARPDNPMQGKNKLTKSSTRNNTRKQHKTIPCREKPSLGT